MDGTNLKLREDFAIGFAAEEYDKWLACNAGHTVAP
jgi:hypothetical protein